LRTDLSKINVKYIANIRAAALENEAIHKRNVRIQFIEKVNNFSGKLPADTITSWTQHARSQKADLNTFQGSLASYNRSLHLTLSQLKDFRTKYSQSESNARLNNYLTTAEQDVQRKIDSLQISVEITNDNLKAYSGLSHQVKETVTKQLSKEKPDSATVKSSLWKAGGATVTKEKILSNLKDNYRKSKSLDTYVNKTAWTSRVLLIILVLAYLYWIISTAYVLNKHNNRDLEKKLSFNFWVPIGKAIVLLLTLLPIVSIVTPTLVIQGIQLLIMAIFGVLLRNQFTLKHRKIVGVLLLFYICDIFVNSVVSEEIIIRIVCIVFNIVALGIGFYLKKNIKDSTAAGYIQLPIFIIFAILNGGAIILNMLGYVDHSRSFSIAAAVGLAQSFTLTFFAQMIKDDVKNQFSRNHVKKGFWMRFNEERALKATGDVLKFLCLVLAIIVLANNLQFAASLASSVSKFLSSSHQLGGISFTFGNLLLAVIILSTANWFQKNLNLLLIGGENGTISTDYDQKMTLFPLFRVIIIVIGFFIAVSALGVGLDKLTVIVGALSVGIGLGMQNIINNFVSGIILAFDKPFRVGDRIELADKKGRVKEIGIRASVLNTGDGAEVIIPNGDLLSGRVVNWTLTNDDAKTSFVVQVDRSADLETLKSWIRLLLKRALTVNLNWVWV
jgi:small-conductance mechanosensitive channel